MGGHLCCLPVLITEFESVKDGRVWWNMSYSRRVTVKLKLIIYHVFRMGLLASH